MLWWLRRVMWFAFHPSFKYNVFTWKCFEFPGWSPVFILSKESCRACISAAFLDNNEVFVFILLLAEVPGVARGILKNRILKKIDFEKFSAHSV